MVNVEQMQLRNGQTERTYTNTSNKHIYKCEPNGVCMLWLKHNAPSMAHLVVLTEHHDVPDSTQQNINMVPDVKTGGPQETVVAQQQPRITKPRPSMTHTKSKTTNANKRLQTWSHPRQQNSAGETSQPRINQPKPSPEMRWAENPNRVRTTIIPNGVTHNYAA